MRSLHLPRRQNRHQELVSQESTGDLTRRINRSRSLLSAAASGAPVRQELETGKNALGRARTCDPRLQKADRRRLLKCLADGRLERLGVEACAVIVWRFLDVCGKRV